MPLMHYAAYGLDRLDHTPRQMFILGASRLPSRWFSAGSTHVENVDGYKVNNLCVQASNITEMEQVVDLIEERVDLSSLDRPIFVIGGHFISFLENKRKFGGNTTNIQNELIRFRLYRVDEDYVRPM